MELVRSNTACRASSPTPSYNRHCFLGREGGKEHSDQRTGRKEEGEEILRLFPLPTLKAEVEREQGDQNYELNTVARRRGKTIFVEQHLRHGVAMSER